MSSRLTVFALGTFLVLAAGHTSAQNPTLRTAMRNKLVNTQRLFEAVVTADYPAINRSVDALSQISETEIASWQAGAQPEYRKQAMHFVSSVQALHEAAATKDLDAVLTGYTALVSSCTRCHAHVRRMRTVSFEP
jgi:hypothetical protein